MIRARLPRTTALVAGLAGLTAGLLAGFSPTSAEDEPLTVVRFAAGVGDQPAYSALHVAQWQGFFREEGLDLRFVVNPGDLQENLANGLTEFSTGNSVDTLSARARGVDVVALGTTMRSETLGIMSRAGSALAPGEIPITTLDDLIGKKVGVTGIVGNRRLLQALLTNNGIPFKSYCGPGALSCVNDDGDPTDDPTVFEADKVNIQIVGGGTPQLLANRSIDAIGDAPWYRVPPFYNKALAVPVGETSTYHRIEFSSLGAPYSYIGTINVGEAWLNTPGNAEIAVKFMKAFGHDRQPRRPSGGVGCRAVANPARPADLARRSRRSIGASAGRPAPTARGRRPWWSRRTGPPRRAPGRAGPGRARRSSAR